MNERRRHLARLIYTLLQCTWGVGQTLIGLIVFLVCAKRPHRIYHGAVDTRWKMRKGLSLGLFIFTPDDPSAAAQRTRVHEYGHTVQSLMLGPVYLVLVLASLVWAGLPCFVRLRRDKGVAYDAFFIEAWATALGRTAEKKRAAMSHDFIGGI